MSESREPERWDAIVVGGGAAGLSAALTLGRACRRVLVLDAGEPRNRFAAHMHGMLGHDGIDPAELLRQGRKEVAAYDVTIRLEAVIDVADADGGLTVTLAGGGQLHARALVVASGLTDDLPAIPGVAEQWGIGVLHCPYCHGWEVRGQRLGVLGTSPVSLHHAELIRQWSDRLTFFTAGCGPIDPELRARLRSRGVELVDVPVTGLSTVDGRLTGARLADGAEVGLDAVFVAPTLRPHDEFLAALELEQADNPMGSFITVDFAGQTSHPRIWAIGNVVNPGANVPISIGAGSMTGGAVNMALVSEEFDLAAAARSAESAAEHWESQYADQPRRWSGRVNPTLAEVVSAIPVDPDGQQRAALDLGCGEGGDAVWLADQGWQVTAVDISATATARGAEGARARGVGDQITWVCHDLATWTTEETFDLVTASFFHSTVELPRTEILRRAAAWIRPGGHLLIVSHVFETDDDIPPWSRRWLAEQGGQDHDHGHLHDLLATPAEDVAALALDDSDWDVVLAEMREREATGPDGLETATVKDGVVLIRRVAH